MLVNDSLTVPTLSLDLSQAISLNIHRVTLAQRITDEAVWVERMVSIFSTNANRALIVLGGFLVNKKMVYRGALRFCSISAPTFG